jgi:hypothetical protein
MKVKIELQQGLKCFGFNEMITNWLQIYECFYCFNWLFCKCDFLPIKMRRETTKNPIKVVVFMGFFGTTNFRLKWAFVSFALTQQSFA